MEVRARVGGAKGKAVVEALKSPSSLSTVWSVVTGAFEVPRVRGMSD